MTDDTEFVTMMAGLPDVERARLFALHLADHGEATMTASLQATVAAAERNETDPSSPVWDGLPSIVAESFAEGNQLHRNRVVAIWNSWVDVVNAARSGSAPAPATPRPTPTAPAPRTTDVSPAPAVSTCPSCGVPANGRCLRCLDDDVLQDHIEYDRRLYEVEQDRIDFNRLQDDRDDYDTSPSYNDTSYYDNNYGDY